MSIKVGNVYAKAVIPLMSRNKNEGYSANVFPRLDKDVAK